MVNLLVDKVIAEKVNNDRKHIKLTIYFDFNTPDIDIDLDMNTKNELKSRSLQTLACRRQTPDLKCSCIDTKQPRFCQARSTTRKKTFIQLHRKVWFWF